MCAIIVKLSARGGGNWSLKIEQQERSTKHISKCEIQISSKSYIYSNKVKEAKINSSKKR